MQKNSGDRRTRYASQLIQRGQHKPITNIWQNHSSERKLQKKIILINI